MEVEFVYLVTCSEEQHAALEAAARRAEILNPIITWYSLTPRSDEGTAVFAIRSQGHDRSQVTRRFVAPIRAVYTKAKIPAKNVQLMSSLLVPNGRHLTLAEGRTPMGTFTDPALRQMLADHGTQLRETQQAASGEA